MSFSDSFFTADICTVLFLQVRYKLRADSIVFGLGFKDRILFYEGIPQICGIPTFGA